MLIALIDDGIEASACPNIRIRFDLSVGSDCVIKNRNADEKIITDHGTTCAKIIAKYAPNAEFCSLRIFHNEKLRASCDLLIAALEWCFTMGIPIIHMSIGSTRPGDYKEIRPVVARIIQQRQIIIAACSNKVGYSIPACLNGVLGVMADKGLKDEEYTIASDRLPNLGLIHASSRHKIVLSQTHEYTTPISNSYAAPTVTAAVHHILEKSGAYSLSVVQLYARLSKDSENILFLRPEFIENAVLLNPCSYPFLKEHFFFSCLGEYRSLSNLQVAIPNSKNIVYLAPQDARIPENFWFEKKDDIECVLYCGKLPKKVKDILPKALVWSEDNCIYPEYTTEKQDVDSPAVINLYGKGLEAIDVMCRLRQMFIEEGYQCMGISDYPFSYLYDLEFVPEGVSTQSAARYLNELYQPEVIINNYQIPGHTFDERPDAFSIFLQDGKSYKNTFFIESQSSYMKPNADKREIALLYDKILKCFL